MPHTWQPAPLLSAEELETRAVLKNLSLAHRALAELKGILGTLPNAEILLQTLPLQDWLPVPADWSNSIVQGKTYSTHDGVGAALWQQLEVTLAGYLANAPSTSTNAFVTAEDTPQYSTSVLRKVRIGQGAFRLSVTDAYARRCAITGEKTLPVLEAAHIRPYSSAGPNLTANGLLLRSDMHKLFDEGYLTITPNFRVEVSKRIKEEFENGKEYYQYHGKELMVLPKVIANRPASLYLGYHNTTIFRA